MTRRNPDLVVMAICLVALAVMAYQAWTYHP